MTKRIAVIGSGISGVSAAWLLRDCADVTLYEAQARFGGHTHTFGVEEGDRLVSIDTGFMVYNKPNYPILTALFDHVGVESYATNMSFSVSMDSGRLEYAGKNIGTLFSQRRNMMNPRFWRMLTDILRFNRLADEIVRSEGQVLPALGAFLDQHRFSDGFRRDYLYPMAAAIWSCPQQRIAAFPTRSFLRFFFNHGLIRLTDRPQWLTVKGGSSTYLNLLLNDLGSRAHGDSEVTAVCRKAQGVELRFSDGRRCLFDEVVLACHSDQALALMQAPFPDERALLAAIPYQENSVYLHTDERLMPQRRSVWSSWNYLSRQGGADELAVCVSYWMNSLQQLNTDRNYFVTLNPPVTPRDDTIVAEFKYDHPVFEGDVLAAQQRLPGLQGRQGVWFAGAWTGYGFHEDGIRSGVEVARALGARIPWEDALEQSAELAMLPRLVGGVA